MSYLLIGVAGVLAVNAVAFCVMVYAWWKERR